MVPYMFAYRMAGSLQDENLWYPKPQKWIDVIRGPGIVEDNLPKNLLAERRKNSRPAVLQDSSEDEFTLQDAPAAVAPQAPPPPAEGAITGRIAGEQDPASLATGGNRVLSVIQAAGYDTINKSMNLQPGTVQQGKPRRQPNRRERKTVVTDSVKVTRGMRKLQAASQVTPTSETVAAIFASPDWADEIEAGGKRVPNSDPYGCMQTPWRGGSLHQGLRRCSMAQVVAMRRSTSTHKLILSVASYRAHVIVCRACLDTAVCIQVLQWKTAS